MVPHRSASAGVLGPLALPVPGYAVRQAGGPYRTPGHRRLGRGKIRWEVIRIVQPMTLMSIGLYNEPQGAFLPSIVY